MTEKQYGGNTGRGTENKLIKINKTSILKKQSQIKIKTTKLEESNQKTDKQKIILAGEITSQVKKYARTIVKKGIPLLELAEKIEKKIIELGGKPAFPVNLSINEIAAHYTPSYDDKTLASGLLKVDFGVHINGWIADNSFSVDLDNSEINKKLIETSEEALNNAIKKIKNNAEINDIGKEIQKTIEAKGFSPIINLSGHSIEKYNLHAGLTIPNVENQSNKKIIPGTYAIEPFVTTKNGSGKIRDGKTSGIYSLVETKNVRSEKAREVLNFIIKEYNTLPFCSRWIVKKFGISGLIGLKQLEDVGNLHQFNQLIEASNEVVAQTENTILVEKEKITITSE